MKIITLFFATAMALAGCVSVEPKGQAAASTLANALVPYESETLADACRLIRLLNEDKWDELAKSLSSGSAATETLRRYAAEKDWAGIGAYRRTEIDEKSPLKIRHCFGFAPRHHPHEVWLIYTITESGPTKPSLSVLGW